MPHCNPLALAVLSACLLSAPASAAGQAHAQADDFDPQLKFVVQRDLGIFPGQIPQYLQTERVAAANEAQLERDLGRDYAGSWIERRGDGSFRYVVATAGVGNAGTLARTAAAGIDVRPVRYSLRDLQASMAQLDGLQARAADAKDGLRGIRAWHVDPQSNRVVVTVAPDATARAVDFLATSGIDAAQVRVETLAGQLLPQATVRGGIRYDLPNSWCSVAFAVMRGTQKGFVTAGHCVNPGQRVSIGGERVGEVAASKFPGLDRAWVRVDDAHRISPWVQKGDGAIGVRGRTHAPVGAAVCRSGARTGYHCGRIVAHDVTVHYDTGDTVRHMSQSGACSGAGDSGGSWITPSGQAQGVHSGGTVTEGGNGCNLPPSQSRSFYSPLNPILDAYGLQLVKAD